MAYTTGINENLLVSGAAAAAPKFAGYSKEIGKFKENLQANAKLRQQQLDVEKKENDLRSAEYLSIDSVDTSGLGSDVLGATTEAAVNLKNKAFDLIKRKSSMGVTEFNIQYAGLLKEVQSLNGMNKIKKALGTQYIEAKKDGDAAPWADPEQQRLIQLVIDQDIKDKKWINKDGKMFLSVTKDGKTDEINLADLKPIETSDPSSYLKLEDAARKRLKTMSLNSGSLTEDRIRQVAEKSVLGLSDTEAKNAALYYVLTDVNTGTKRSLEEQRAYFRPKDGQTKEERMFEIRKDIANTLYNRELILYGNDLNKLKQPKQTSTAGSGISNASKTRALNFYNGIKTNPKAILDQVNLKDYRIIGNVVELANGTSYDLNNPGGILGLLSSISQEYYGKNEKTNQILDAFDILVDNDPDFNFSNKPQVSTENTEGVTPLPQNEIAGAGLFASQPTTETPKPPEPPRFPENIKNLSTEDVGIGEFFSTKRSGLEKRVIRKIENVYGNVFSEQNVAKAKYDVFEREEAEAEEARMLEEREKLNATLKGIASKIRNASKRIYEPSELPNLNIAEKREFAEIIGKPIGDASPYDILKYQYIKAGGNAKDLEAIEVNNFDSFEKK
jgi:hypothetical protein